MPETPTTHPEASLILGVACHRSWHVTNRSISWPLPPEEIHHRHAPRRQYHFPPHVISLIYEHYRARYPGDRRCSSRFTSVSRAWAHEVEKFTFRRLIVDVSTVTTTHLDSYQNLLYVGAYHSPYGGDDLTKLESYVRGPRRAFLRELVFVLPDPMRHVDTAAVRRIGRLGFAGADAAGLCRSRGLHHG
ncbi:hypothetical protein PG993_014043 [Apiospora rasikravindrae]|uniref:Uncharacterized protein n=1 Tax=Apiospora rasikravindrae TaxID=990691 RepID=A0ABR1RS44_9PEZI